MQKRKETEREGVKAQNIGLSYSMTSSEQGQLIASPLRECGYDEEIGVTGLYKQKLFFIVPGLLASP